MISQNCRHAAIFISEIWKVKELNYLKRHLNSKELFLEPELFYT